MTRTRNFWSNRRAEVEAEEQAEQQAAVAKQTELEQAEIEARDDADILAELNLPDPDELQAGDDVRGFMSQAVPDRLRRRALRQLWKLNPVLANVDGLVDYGEDYTDAATVIENMQTAYQVGKGMLSHVEELARQAEEKQAESESIEPESTDPDAPDQLAEAEDQPPADPVAPAEVTQPPPVPETEDATLAMPRRMRFAFDPDARSA